MSNERTDKRLAADKLLADGKRVNPDVQMVARAIREKWEIPPEKAKALCKRLIGICDRTKDAMVLIRGFKALVDADKVNLQREALEQNAPPQAPGKAIISLPAWIPTPDKIAEQAAMVDTAPALVDLPADAGEPDPDPTKTKAAK